VEEIAQHNILWASVRAMHKALNQLSLKPDLILVDGKYFSPWNEVPYRCIPDGDATQACISAASILAKVERDLFMDDLHQAFPSYGWDRNKGYATDEHKKAILKHGLTIYHRKQFVSKLIMPNLFE
ncbi:MAG: ribonuclease HII, partial [Flavobacteriales bacterium]|nr:ribonuclease HII [Flavobacteriales bacterium]